MFRGAALCPRHRRHSFPLTFLTPCSTGAIVTHVVLLSCCLRK